MRVYLDALGGVAGDMFAAAIVDAWPELEQPLLAALDAAGGLLCIGTSLAVNSAFRFARRARDDGIPICILNRGPTRCDAEDFPDLTKVNAGVAALAEAVVGM